MAQEYNSSVLNLERTREVHYLAAIGSWRYTQGIYCFNEELFQNVTQMKTIKYVDEVKFYQLPEWSIYIQSPKLLE